MRTKRPYQPLKHSVELLQLSASARILLILFLDIKVLYEVGDIVVVIVRTSAGTGALLTLLDSLVRLSEFSQRRQGIWAKLVENSGYELCKLLNVTSAIDREGVCRYGGMD